MTQIDPTIDRLEDQIAWYDQKSASHQRWFKNLKLLEMVTASVIPLSAGLGGPAWLTGGLGVIVVVVEGLQNVNQFHANWMNYRSTCESLKHEKYLWLAKSGPYQASQNPDVLLAERIESLISREHAQWISSHQRIRKRNEKEED